MIPNEVYAFEPIEVSKDLWCLDKVFDCVRHFLYSDHTPKDHPVTIRHYAYEDFDGRRTWSFFSVFFEENPVAICERSGREGDDHIRSFVTDKKGFENMRNYFLSFSSYTVEEYEMEEPNLVGEFKDCPSLGRFYGHTLEEFYNPKGMNPNYREGDIVLAWTPENHLRDTYKKEKAMVLTRCEIVRIHPFSPSRTYFVKQLDRRWETKEETLARGETNPWSWIMVTDMGNGGVGAWVSDALITELLEKNPLYSGFYDENGREILVGMYLQGTKNAFEKYEVRLLDGKPTLFWGEGFTELNAEIASYLQIIDDADKQSLFFEEEPSS